MGLFEKCDCCNNRSAMDDPRIREACQNLVGRRVAVSSFGEFRVCALCRLLRVGDSMGGCLTEKDIKDYVLAYCGVQESECQELVLKYGLRLVPKKTVKWLDAQEYCRLSDVEKRCAKSVFPMALCEPDRKNCKIVENWDDVFEEVEKYISTHQSALDMIKKAHTANNRRRICKWLPKVSSDNRRRGMDVWHMERPRPGLLMRRIAQLSKLTDIRACLVFVSKKDVGKTASRKKRNLLAKARKILPSLRHWGIVGWKGWATCVAQP